MLPGHDNFKWIAADWPVPGHVYAGSTTRCGGISQPPYDSLNLAAHVGDKDKNVSHNRQRLINELQLPAEPAWLEQQHGCEIIDAAATGKKRRADGAYTNITGHVCVVLTADCLPLLICDRDGDEIAAIHIGWRGYTKKIITAAIKTFRQRPENLLAWIGPCISAGQYEVGNEVRQACLSVSETSAIAFTPSRKDHWYADIQLLVRLQLQEYGLENVFGGQYCTYVDKSLFYSYRRDRDTGRTASMIWMDS